MTRIFRESIAILGPGGAAGLAATMVERQKLVFKWLADLSQLEAGSPNKSLEDDLDDTLEWSIPFGSSVRQRFDANFVWYDAERQILLFNNVVDLDGSTEAPDYLVPWEGKVVYLVIRVDTPGTVAIVAPDTSDADWWLNDFRDGNQPLPLEFRERIVAAALQ
ncbi:MAG TPA: hypothetical protein VFO38_01635 [Candidatus Saccharimonadales bacterium]|nr:hypothetical protein [Candidatus Saccharimonadales bacterium]